MIRPPPISTLFPSTPLFRSEEGAGQRPLGDRLHVRPTPAERRRDVGELAAQRHPAHQPVVGVERDGEPDRKSTRLNSSHANISYAVFCLKKKNATSREML